ITGDGDCSAIGGNHLIHACRRNIGLTVVTFNNNIYGMTGGQYSPTTPTGDYGTTAPYGNIDRPFDVALLAAAAGATYAAHGDCFHVPETTRLIRDGIAHKGFSIIEVADVCPTYYGRKNKKGSAVDMMRNQKENFVTAAQAKRMSPEELEGRYVLGVIQELDFPEYTEAYEKVIEKAQGGAK
ncbi:MAG: 2-oxoacid:ferredoxin oxidoreductase subunit beta, partial [Lachnospiraceae bacterium]|nr:2-oxoacid:ferredoxin oxidoreductase subunit beta [Lachnospiraceae bacterium]